jgi:hypothetical protein
MRMRTIRTLITGMSTELPAFGGVRQAVVRRLGVHPVWACTDESERRVHQMIFIGHSSRRAIHEDDPGVAAWSASSFGRSGRFAACHPSIPPLR